jgi:hypothetical protein
MARGVDEIAPCGGGLNDRENFDAPAAAAEFLTVAISTLDRPGAIGLARALAGEARALKGVGVSIFSNGPTNHLAPEAAGLQGVDYFHDEVAGLSRARNRALRTSTARYVLFLDDDVVPPSGYLARVVDSLGSHAPDILGAPIDPMFDEAPPASLPIEYVTRRKAQKSGWLTHGAVSGGNFAVRRDVALQIGGFREDLGMTGTRMAFLEELEFVLRYRASPIRSEPGIYYDLDCALAHPMPADTTRISYLTKRAWRSHYEKGQFFAQIAGERRRGAYRCATIAAVFATIIGRAVSTPREWAKDGVGKSLARTRLAIAGAAGVAAGAILAHGSADFPHPEKTLHLGDSCIDGIDQETDLWAYGAVRFRGRPSLRSILKMTLEAPATAIESEAPGPPTDILCALSFLQPILAQDKRSA